MYAKIIGGLVAAVGLGLAGATAAPVAKVPADCCGTGAECCYPGSPCCEASVAAADCCGTGAACCAELVAVNPVAKTVKVSVKVSADCCGGAGGECCAVGAACCAK